MLNLALKKNRRSNPAPCPGFVYCASDSGGVLKIGMTTQADPFAYVRLRYADLLDVTNVVAVPDAPAIERILHLILDGHRVLGRTGRELFVGVSSDAVQEAIEEACAIYWNMRERGLSWSRK